MFRTLYQHCRALGRPQKFVVKVSSFFDMTKHFSDYFLSIFFDAKLSLYEK